LYFPYPWCPSWIGVLLYTWEKGMSHRDIKKNSNKQALLRSSHTFLLPLLIHFCPPILLLHKCPWNTLDPSATRVELGKFTDMQLSLREERAEIVWKYLQMNHIA
jgi:hypothetical protein